MRILIPVLALTLFHSDVLRAEKVAILMSKNLTAYNEALKGFSGKFGNNYTLYDMEGSMMRGHEISREINAEGYDLVIALGTKGATVAKMEIREIPILFCMVTDPAAQELIGPPNIAGISFGLSINKQLETLKQFIPNAKKIGIFYNPENSNEFVRKARTMAGKYQAELVAVEVYSKRDVPIAIKKLLKKEVDAFWMIPDAALLSQPIIKELLVFTLGNRIPFMAPSETFVKEGALFSVSSDYLEQGKQVSDLAVRILNGESPGNIGLIEPQEFNIGINLKTAEAIGIKIPKQLIQKAQVLIE